MSEPLFTAIDNKDPLLALAHSLVAASIDEFRDRLRAPAVLGSAKLRFRDPDRSAALGKDCFFYLWLGDACFHADENLYSGQFFEVPDGFEKYHPLGSRLGFEAEDMFDWMVNDDGRIAGGYTLRLARSRLPADQRAEYDRHVGASSWEPLPFDGVLDPG
jgi:uncharacterized protein YegJ (DUF2314 family)